MQEPQKCDYAFLPFFFSSPITKPPCLSIWCFFLGFPLSCLYSALLQLVSESCACFSYSGSVLLHFVHPGPNSYPVMTVQPLCATKKSLIMVTLRLFCLLHLLKICQIYGKTLRILPIQWQKRNHFLEKEPVILYKVSLQNTCTKTKVFALVDSLCVPL